MVDGVGTSWVQVSFENDDFTAPVVVCSATVPNPTNACYVTRVRSVTAEGFEVRLQNPSGGTGFDPATVYYLAVEKGAWILPDGRKVEAQSHVSTVTDHDQSWEGETRAFLQSYANPVVLGQVLSSNDSDWSVFWCSGTWRSDPPSRMGIKTGKTVCEDSDTSRQNETVGFIVFEQGYGALDGVPYEVWLGPDSVRGTGTTEPSSPPYPYSFNRTFESSPTVAVVSQAGMDDDDGGWAVLYGSDPITTNQLSLAVDEDRIDDSESDHGTEQVAYFVVGATMTISTDELVYPALGGFRFTGDEDSDGGRDIDPR